MSTETKRNGINLWSVLAGFFSTETYIKEDELDPELKEAQLNADKKMNKSSEPINVNVGKTNKKSGLKKYEKPTITIEEMTPEKLDEMRKKLGKKLGKNQDNEITK